MIQSIILFIVACLIGYESAACNEKNIICNTVCKHDDDELGIVLNDKCYCANYRDLDKYVVRVPKHGKAVVSQSNPYPWVRE